jgi:hypothetical protein
VPPPTPAPDERLDHVSRVGWALAAFILIGALPFVATLMVAGAADPSDHRAAGESVAFFLQVDLVLGVLAAAVTYGLASIPSRAARSVLLALAMAGSLMVGFVVGFFGAFITTSPNMGDH